MLLCDICKKPVDICFDAHDARDLRHILTEGYMYLNQVLHIDDYNFVCHICLKKIEKDYKYYSNAVNKRVQEMFKKRAQKLINKLLRGG